MASHIASWLRDEGATCPLRARWVGRTQGFTVTDGAAGRSADLHFTEVDECFLTCGQAGDVFSWLALSRAVVRTECGPSRPGGTGLGRALNTGS
jgi:hypothetical protein